MWVSVKINVMISIWVLGKVKVHDGLWVSVKVVVAERIIVSLYPLHVTLTSMLSATGTADFTALLRIFFSFAFAWLVFNTKIVVS